MKMQIILEIDIDEDTWGPIGNPFAEEHKWFSKDVLTNLRLLWSDEDFLTEKPATLIDWVTVG